jgi:N utilization substance protein B
MLALMALYEIDITGHDPEEVISRTLEEPEEHGEEEEGSLPTPDPLLRQSDEVRSRVERLIHGVLAEQAKIDLLITSAAPAFPLRQFSGVDRNVLRLATYELLEENDVPVSVAINEAVELAKRFGGENSGRFVNGTLGTISERLGAPPR